MEPRNNQYVGVFDSGLGGISVLRRLVEVLPHESFVYFGDSANAPYGEKPQDWVVQRSRELTQSLINDGAKAVVIACNTATSAAAANVRAAFPDVPIIGVEPALKPAVMALKKGHVLVMATPITLKLDKFHQLAEKWGGTCQVVPAPCPGLAARIEQGDLDAPDVIELLESLIGEYAGRVEAVVLGCTHYSFVSHQIREVLGDVPLFDGAQGTAEHTKRRLEQADLLSQSSDMGTVEFLSSKPGEDEIAMYRRFFQK